MNILKEAFDTEPYAWTTTFKPPATEWFVFEEDNGNKFRLDITSPSQAGAGDMGKKVKVIRIGQNTGGTNYKSVITKFKDPRKVIATMIDILSRYREEGKFGIKTDGFAFKFDSKAFGPYQNLVKKILATKLNKQFTVSNSNYTPDEKVSYVYMVKKGRQFKDVFNGSVFHDQVFDSNKKVDADLVADDTENKPSSVSVDTEPEIEELEIIEEPLTQFKVGDDITIGGFDKIHYVINQVNNEKKKYFATVYDTATGSKLGTGVGIEFDTAHTSGSYFSQEGAAPIQQKSSAEGVKKGDWFFVKETEEYAVVTGVDDDVVYFDYYESDGSYIEENEATIEELAEEIDGGNSIKTIEPDWSYQWPDYGKLTFAGNQLFAPTKTAFVEKYGLGKYITIDNVKRDIEYLSSQGYTSVTRMITKVSKDVFDESKANFLNKLPFIKGQFVYVKSNSGSMLAGTNGQVFDVIIDNGDVEYKVTNDKGWDIVKADALTLDKTKSNFQQEKAIAKASGPSVQKEENAKQDGSAIITPVSSSTVSTEIEDNFSSIISKAVSKTVKKELLGGLVSVTAKYNNVFELLENLPKLKSLDPESWNSISEEVRSLDNKLIRFSNSNSSFSSVITNTLTSDHMQAVSRYTGNAYKVINNAFRGGDMPDVAKKQIGLIDETYASAGVRLKDCVVYRGQRTEKVELEHLESGGVLCFPTYTSTSLRLSVALSFGKSTYDIGDALTKEGQDIQGSHSTRHPSVFQIEKLENTLSLPILGASYFPKECEIIVNRSTYVRLVKAGSFVSLGDGTKFYRVEVVGKESLTESEERNIMEVKDFESYMKEREENMENLFDVAVAEATSQIENERATDREELEEDPKWTDDCFGIIEPKKPFLLLNRNDYIIGDFVDEMSAVEFAEKKGMVDYKIIPNV